MLVTSQTPRALRVLQEKFPKDIQPLVVSVLDEKETSRLSLENSVNGILSRINNSNRTEEMLSAQINVLTRDRGKERAELSNVRRLLREIRESDTRKYAVPGTNYAGTPQQIAAQISSVNGKFEWLEDEVGQDIDLPLTNIEISELMNLLKTLGDQFQELRNSQFPDINILPQPREIAALISTLRKSHSAAKNIDSTLPNNAWFATLKSADLDSLQLLCRQWLRIHATATGRNGWNNEALIDILSRSSSKWISLEHHASETLNQVRQIVNGVGECSIEHSAEISIDQQLADAEDLLKHVRSGGGFGIIFFRAKVVRRTAYLWSKSRIDGRLCADESTLHRLVESLRLQVLLKRLAAEWSSDVLQNGTLRMRLSSLEENLTSLRELLKLDAFTQDIGNLIEDSLEVASHVWSAEFVAQTLESVKAGVVLQEKRNADAAWKTLINPVTLVANVNDAHVSLSDLHQACFNYDSEKYRATFVAVTAAHKMHLESHRIAELLGRVQTAAPQLCDRLNDPLQRESLAEPLSEFENAWAWKRASAWLKRYDAQHADDESRNRLQRSENRMLELTTDLIAAKAWHACLCNLGQSSERQNAMKAWQWTINMIGGGTGKHADSHRRNARKYLEQCWDALPAHIMPLYRVAEQFPFDKPEMFDIVIVDEASQTGPEGLLLTFLAKQCVIVGDDKQISPEAGFVDVAAVQTLIDKWIPDLSFANTLIPGTSLFDQTQIRHQSRLTLREHFRCMPEIIRFSNELSYDGKLMPLRQYPADRLVPLVDRFVTDGYREGTSERIINRPEAAALVKALIECLENPKYHGKSFGVICLQGHAQAKLIESMILEKCGPEPFKDPKVRLLCGDAYSFQGDERHVIFLSMVAAVEGDNQNTAFTKKTFLQRFNVAASRAQDQMWLFHSIREADLHPNCVRRRLVQFMSSNPELHAPTVDLRAIRHDAIHLQRTPRADGYQGNQPAPFDSWFEVDVFLALIDRGYRVLPQISVSEKRIDLVVEDPKRRIAVECDGDEWHGPDQYEADCLREAILNRSGWEFARIRASAFYANRSSAIDTLVAKIAQQNVHPWCPSEDQANYSASDIGEVSGAECLQWLGNEIAESAEDGLSQINSDDSGLPVDEMLHFVRDSFDSQSVPDAGQDGISETSVQESITVKAVPIALLESRINTVRKFLLRMGEPRTAGSIKYQTGIPEHDWPQIEQELLNRNLVTKSGTSRRPYFQWISK